MADFNDDWRLENLKGTITLAAQTIKSLELVNGGAAIAVLTFYGHLPAGVNKNALTLALTWFGLGVATAVCCSLASYLAQRCAALQDARELALFWTAVVFGGASTALFVVGLISAASAVGV